MNVPLKFVESVSAPRSMTLGELGEGAGHLLGVEASSHCLHYCAPTHGGWGVIRTAMLVPEMYMLFVCPAACGRHGAIAAIEQGCKDRVGYLCIEESEIVLGSYEEEIRRAVPALLESLHPRPQAFMVVVSCIDDLLGTDYASMIAGFEERFGIPFRLGRMNPITLDGKLPPGKRIQRDMYDFLDAPGERTRHVGTLGLFTPLDDASELRSLLHGVNGGSLLHIAETRNFQEFQVLARVCLNLVIRPEGLDAAVNVHDKFGTPYLFAPVAFSESLIEKRYATIGAFFGTNLHCADAVARRRSSAHRVLEVVGNRTIAIDDSATCSPFDLARALLEAGFAVREIYTQKLPEFERSAFQWLVEHAPDVRVTSPIHHANSWLRAERTEIDVAIGFTAAYLSGARSVVPMTFDEGGYGHHGMTLVLDGLERAVLGSDGDGLEGMVRAYGLVV